MDTMLIKLLWLRLRGGVRQRLREIKTLRGLLFLALTVAVIVLLMKQSVLSDNLLNSVIMGEAEQRQRMVEQFMPIGLLGAFLMTVFTAPSPALSFNPSEINLLFSGPFTRRALLLYKISFYTFGVFLSSLLIMLLVSAFNYWSISTFLGVSLSMLFIQLLTVSTGLLGQWLGQYVDMRIRSGYVFMALISLFAATGWYCSDSFNSPISAMLQFQESTTGALLLAPFDVFAHIFLSQSLFPELVLWVLLGLTMILVLLIVVIVLDDRCYEASTMASLELHQRWDRARRRGVTLGRQIVKVRSFVRSPVLFGIGPLAWRQMLATFRNASKALFVYLGIALFAGPLLVKLSVEFSLWTMLGGVFFVAVFMLPRTLVYDFRSDLDAMENFKVLPLPVWKISIGQMATMIMLSCLIELVLLVSTAVFVEAKWYSLLVGIGLFLLPFNLLLYGLENLFFLLFPAPLVPVGRVDFDFLGRTLVGFAMTSAILIGSCFFAAIAGLKLGQAMTWPWPVMVMLAWFALTLIALLTLPLLGWAFKRFDVGVSGKSNR